jgi:hypothetical protein
MNENHRVPAENTLQLDSRLSLKFDDFVQLIAAPLFAIVKNYPNGNSQHKILSLRKTQCRSKAVRRF